MPERVVPLAELAVKVEEYPEAALTVAEAARAAASQPSLPLDLPDEEEKPSAEKLLPAVEEVQVGFRQESVTLQPYR